APITKAITIRTRRTRSSCRCSQKVICPSGGSSVVELGWGGSWGVDMNQEAGLDSVSLNAGSSGSAAAGSVAAVSATDAVGSGSAGPLDGGGSGLAAAGSAAVV